MLESIISNFINPSNLWVKLRFHEILLLTLHQDMCFTGRYLLVDQQDLMGN